MQLLPWGQDTYWVLNAREQYQLHLATADQSLNEICA